MAVETLETSLLLATGQKHAVLLVTHDEDSQVLHLHGNVGGRDTVNLLEGALELAKKQSEKRTIN